MKRLYRLTLFILALVATHAAPARAALCAPQTEFTFSSLQNQLNTLGESIDVLTQQSDGLVWSTNASSNATISIMFQLAGNPNHDEFGIVGIDAAHGPSGLCPVFGAQDWVSGGFAVVSFRAGGLLRVNRFDADAVLVSSATFAGVDGSRFGYYVRTADGTFFSHMGYNADGKVHALVFAGTGPNTGSWWMAWEDSTNPSASADFGDCLLFLGGLNPTPVQRTSWAALKSRFR